MPNPNDYLYVVQSGNRHSDWMNLLAICTTIEVARSLVAKDMELEKERGYVSPYRFYTIDEHPVTETLNDALLRRSRLIDRTETERLPNE